ncbi:endonuclease VII domain-containing protein [Blastococcus sp. SYSU D00813]
MEFTFCRDCGSDQPISEFTRNRNSRDGYAFYCRAHARRRHRAAKTQRRGAPQRRYRNDVPVPEGHKWCPDCDSVLPLEAVGRNSATRSGINSYCKPCHDTRGRASKEKVGGERSYHLRRRYGITAEEFDALLVEQRGHCAICRKAPADHVDHDHVTGQVRRLLCFNCNGGLGQFRDDPVALRAAASYVERHRAGAVGGAAPRPSRRRPLRDLGWREVRRRGGLRSTAAIARARLAAVTAEVHRPPAG